MKLVLFYHILCYNAAAEWCAISLLEDFLNVLLFCLLLISPGLSICWRWWELESGWNIKLSWLIYTQFCVLGFLSLKKSEQLYGWVTDSQKEVCPGWEESDECLYQNQPRGLTPHPLCLVVIKRTGDSWDALPVLGQIGWISLGEGILLHAKEWGVWGDLIFVLGFWYLNR